MIQQLDLFRAPAPIIEQPCFILPDNSLILVQPTENPTGAEAAERKAAPLGGDNTMTTKHTKENGNGEVV